MRARLGHMVIGAVVTFHRPRGMEVFFLADYSCVRSEAPKDPETGHNGWASGMAMPAHRNLSITTGKVSIP